MIGLGDMLALLSQRRPVFHSEADFQHALAWLIHEQEPDAHIRLEYRPLPHEPLYLDLWVQHDASTSALAIELKYPTRRLDVYCAGEHFSLRNQAAPDTRRYDFIKDIARLERVVAAAPDVTGYAILLTNDSAYWAKSLRANTIDVAFRLHEGACLAGALKWAPQTGPGTMVGREQPLVLQGSYPISWRDYSTVGDNRTAGRFRLVIVRVEHAALAGPA